MSEAIIADVAGQGVTSAELALARRFSHAPRARQEVVYEFSTDPALLHQYHLLRAKAYERVWGFLPRELTVDEHDLSSPIAVARLGKQCIGGCRVSIRPAGSSARLPMETDSFLLDSALPEYDLHNLNVAEYSRFALLEDFCTRENMYALSRLVLHYSAAVGVRYAFVRSKLSLVRQWRIAASAVGINNVMIFDHIDVPHVHGHEEIKMYLGMVDLVGVKPDIQPVGVVPEERNQAVYFDPADAGLEPALS